MIKVYYNIIPGTEPSHREQLDLSLDGGRKSIGCIHRDGTFQPSVHSGAISPASLCTILSLSLRFLERGKDGVPEAEELKVL